MNITIRIAQVKYEMLKALNKRDKKGLEGKVEKEPYGDFKSKKICIIGTFMSKSNAIQR